MTDFSFKVTDQQIVVIHDGGKIDYIHIPEFEEWATTEERLFFTKTAYVNNELVGTDVIPISFASFMLTLDKREIAYYLECKEKEESETLNSDDE